MKKLQEKMWAIKSSHGFYIGTNLTKRDAIKEFLKDTGYETWKIAKKSTEALKAVKVLIKEL